MRFGAEVYVAWRYLWSKKGHNAIHVVSGVSAAAVAVVTAAMICVLSVMNGFGQVIQQMFSEFDPDLKIIPVEGKCFSTATSAFDSVRSLSYVEVCCEVVEETALVEYADKQLPAVLKGVDTNYQQLTHIDSIIVEGQYSVFDGAFERTVMGQGLASQLGVGAFFQSGLHLYAPKRNQRVNMLRPQDSFSSETCFMAGVFGVNQVKYDDKMMLVSVDLTRRLFDYAPHQVTGWELRLKGDYPFEKAQQQIRDILGPNYKVLNRYEQQADFFRVLHVEKWLTALLLVFILLIASFNLIGSLSMLIIDKQRDILVFRNLGANPKEIRRIFLYEGWMISGMGAVAGVVIGVVVCWLQQHYGFLKLGNGMDYVLSAYPVALEWMDVLWVGVVVLLIGFFAAWIPSRPLAHNISKFK